jgi:enoyl-CoA hydratase/carnithine racemase
MIAKPPVNVVTRAPIEQLTSALHRCALGPQVRVVVLGGTGAADLGEALSEVLRTTEVTNALVSRFLNG